MAMSVSAGIVPLSNISISSCAALRPNSSGAMCNEVSSWLRGKCATIEVGNSFGEEANGDDF
ncbi:MAG: hypothetical protein N3B10_04645 [Armatimonadetes bacterium]|nr:hypothetical protein [Armatimonadota bacterium]